MTSFRKLLGVAGILGMALLLSGCVVEPAWGPGYYPHPHYHYWGY